MKLHLMGILLACGMATSANAATVVTSSFSHLGGQTWQADMSIAYDGPIGFSELTLYFPEHSFANLVAISAPSTWDALTVQPDLALPGLGFIDYLFEAPLTLGTLADFSLRFTFLGSGAPQTLRYEGYDSDFNLLLSGQSVAAIPAAIPEPGSWLLVGAGLGLVALQRRKTRRDTAEVAA